MHILIGSVMALAGAALLPATPALAEEPASAMTASGTVSPSETALVALFAEDARRENLLDPLNGLYRGEPVDPQTFAQLYTDGLDRRVLTSARQSLRAVANVARSSLTPKRQISYDVFIRAKREEAAWLEPDMAALTVVRPFNHFGGLHVEFPSLMARDGSVKYESVADYRHALALDAAFPVVLDNATARFRQGIASGVVESRLTVSNMIAQIDGLLAQPLEQSPFMSPVSVFLPGIPASAQPQLRADYTVVVRDQIYPAYRRLRAFLHDEYLPAAREQVGLSAMKGGTGLYRKLIERQTTLPLDPATIHRLGLGEVARIQHEMDGVRAQLGSTGTLPAFFESIRTDPRFHPKTSVELTQAFAKIGREVDAQIPKYFARVPKAKLLIEPFPAYREKYEAGGSYHQGSADGLRPGVFNFNTYDLPSRFLSGTTTLYLHEGIPGHHFQISLAQEDPTLPAFQRLEGNTAYVEGWALYSETLGYQMGFYRDPMQHWGTLDDEMLRAMRLVVDTGLHTQNWSRDQAITYMLTNSGMGRSDATSEVERYIANPAQALGYKIGAMTIQSLRAKAETALGPRFDIRAFHEQVLDSGALPLPVLQAKIERWIAASKQGG